MVGERPIKYETCDSWSKVRRLRGNGFSCYEREEVQTKSERLGWDK